MIRKAPDYSNMKILSNREVESMLGLHPKDYPILKIERDYKKELKTNLVIPSFNQNFSCAVEFMTKWFYNKFPDLSLTNKIKKVYKKLSIPINFIILVISIFIYIFLAYRLSNFLSSQYLIETPSIYFYIMILFLTTYTANKGIETITRVSLITFYTSLIMFIFDFINLIQYIDIKNYLPLITVDYKNILISGIIYALFSTMPLFFITTCKKDLLGVPKS